MLWGTAPEIEQLVGDFEEQEQEEPYSGGGVDVDFTANKNRWHYAIRESLRIVASCCPPLVILLDDLQWADYGSLELIEILMTNNQSDFPPLMIIGCYRSNEIDKSHLLTTTLRDTRSTSQRDESFNVTEVLLGNI
jgi:predicted ATPase